MRNFLLVILVFTIINLYNLQTTNSIYKYLNIDSKEKYIWTYYSNKNLEKNIIDWKIDFEIKSDNWNVDFLCDTKWCFFNVTWSGEINDKWFLFLKSDKSQIEIPFEVNLFLTWATEKISNKKIIKQKKWYFDISDNIVNKSIQERALSCEISATKDIINYLLWKNIKERTLIEEISKSEYKKLPTKNIDWKIIWWNPNAWFVGYIWKLDDWTKATQRWMTGYWVLEKPIIDLYTKYKLATKFIDNSSYKNDFTKEKHLELLLKELEKWNMIQLWWDICSNPDFRWKWEVQCNYNWESSWNKDRTMTWHYEENWELKKYKWLVWEHAFYLLWFKWKISNPTEIIVWDTYSWRQIYPTSEWFRKWNLMENKSIIVYRK